MLFRFFSVDVCWLVLLSNYLACLCTYVFALSTLSAHSNHDSLHFRVDLAFYSRSVTRSHHLYQVEIAVPCVFRILLVVACASVMLNFADCSSSVVILHVQNGHFFQVKNMSPFELSNLTGMQSFLCCFIRLSSFSPVCPIYVHGLVLAI